MALSHDVQEVSRDSKAEEEAMTYGEHVDHRWRSLPGKTPSGWKRIICDDCSVSLFYAGDMPRKKYRENIMAFLDSRPGSALPSRIIRRRKK